MKKADAVKVEELKEEDEYQREEEEEEEKEDFRNLEDKSVAEVLGDTYKLMRKVKGR